MEASEVEDDSFGEGDIDMLNSFSDTYLHLACPDSRPGPRISVTVFQRHPQWMNDLVLRH
jgi:hypothetical protein